MFIGSNIQEEAMRNPSKIAICCDDRTMSYGELFHYVKTIETGIRNRFEGHPEKKKIMFLLPNDIQFLALFLAISHCGAIAAPIDPKWSTYERNNVIRNCQPDLLIFNGKEKLEGKETVYFFQDLIEEKIEYNAQSFERKGLFYIGYTSGTTGEPKGFMRTHLSWLESFRGSDEAFALSENNIVLSPGPLVHSHFLYAALHTLQIGATLFITKKFHAGQLCETLSRHPIDVLYVVPTMLAAITEEMVRQNRVFPKLKKIISAGAKWYPALKETTKERFPNANSFEFYGASELSFVSILDEEGYRKYPHSVGQAFPGVEIVIKLEDGTEAANDEIGKLYVRSKLVFEGYLHNEEATKHVFDGQWASVGDLAFKNKEGYITLVGRENNKLITGGLNVYPEEVENILMKLKEIKAVVVIGIKDVYWGEKVVAVIEWKEKENKLTDNDLKSHCKKFLSSYKCPQLFLQVKEFPYTSSGKIARKEVEKLISK